MNNFINVSSIGCVLFSSQISTEIVLTSVLLFSVIALDQIMGCLFSNIFVSILLCYLSASYVMSHDYRICARLT